MNLNLPLKVKPINEFDIYQAKVKKDETYLDFQEIQSLLRLDISMKKNNRNF